MKNNLEDGENMLNKNYFYKDNIKDIIPLTSIQEGMLYHYRDKLNNITYQEQLQLDMVGDLNLDMFEKAWEYVVLSNEMLRTFIKWGNIENPIQGILNNYNIPIYYEDLTLLTDIEADIKINSYNDEYKVNGIQIDKETLRIHLLKQKDGLHKVIINYHHIILDGWSLGIILKEFIEVYNSYYLGKEIKIKNKAQYRDFVRYNKDLNKVDSYNYWRNYLTDSVNLGLYFEMKENLDVLGEVSISCDEQTDVDLKIFAKQNKITISTILYAAWGILLQRYSNTDDVIFGTTVSGRDINLQGIEDIVGLCINTVPLRIKNNKEMTCIEFLDILNTELKLRTVHTSIPLIEIKECSELKSNHLMFDSIVVIENYPLDFHLNNSSTLKITDYTMKEYNNFNLTLTITTFDKVSIKFNYNKSAISDYLIHQYSYAYLNIIKEIIYNPSKQVDHLEIISEEEKNKLLYEFNDTLTSYNQYLTLHQLFEKQVIQSQNDTAIVFGDKSITYFELNQKSNRLARILRDKGIKKNDFVGIFLDRSIEMIISILAILKAGGAYLPIDPDYPLDRVLHVITDSQANVIITRNSLLDNKCSTIVDTIISMDTVIDNDIECSNLDCITTANDLAYIIYTSGSTGHPKGVMVEHRQLHNFIDGIVKSTNITDYNTILCITTISFDIFFLEAILPLTKGMKIVIANEKEQLDGKELAKLISKTGVEVIQTTPSRMQLLMEDANFLRVLEELKLLLVGGEAISQSLYDKLSIYKELNIYNMYGPTETTVWSTIKELTVGTINIGKPIQNTRIYILDKKNRLLPIGQPGELCISGEGLSRGYFNKIDMTNEKFMIVPYCDNERIYKTGDLAKWLPNGEIEFLGRLDNQVKIRGYRIELEEIENTLRKYKTINAATVIDRMGNDGIKLLVAFFVADEEIQLDDLRNYLSKLLPNYMLPSQFIQLEKLPLTPNGKVDRKTLSNINTNYKKNYIEPRTELESKLIEIWKKVLNKEQIGIDDNFIELGGHSLKAARVSSSISKYLNYSIQIADLFKYPTLRILSNYLENNHSVINILPAEKKEYYEATPAQNRIYMSHCLEPNEIIYNMPNIFRINGTLDKAKLESTFLELINRHDILRTSFHVFDNKIMQKVSNTIDYSINYIENAHNLEKAIAQAVMPFNIEMGPLFRVTLVELKNEYYLIFDMHHIISDGLSMEILKRDFINAYSGKALESLDIQFTDYSEWYNKLLKSDANKQQETYWMKQFSGELPKLNMPLDYSRPVIQNFEGDTIYFNLSQEYVEKIKDFVVTSGCSIYMIMLSVFNILLSKYTNQDDIIIGSPIAGRFNHQMDNLIGMFVNTLPMRNHPKGELTYERFIKEVKNNTINAFENQQYQYEDLLDKLKIKSEISRNPLFDIMFIMQNMDKKKILLDELTFEEVNFKSKVSKYDLTLICHVEKNKLSFEIEYATSLFNKETIERMVIHFENIIQTVMDNPKILISDINMMSEVERNKIVYDFNRTDAGYEDKIRLNKIFEKQVNLTPKKCAVKSGINSLTYEELNNKANQWARLFKNKYKLFAGDVVAIYLPRNIDLVVATLAIQKADAVCLPISKEYPLMRVEQLYKDSNAKLILVDDGVEKYNVFSKNILQFDSAEKLLYSVANIESNLNSETLAYLIYTSGSTGKPKGVMLTHKGIINHIYTKIQETEMSSADICCHNLNIGFVASIWLMYAPLFLGSTLHVYSQEIIQDTELLFKNICEDKVSILEIVPSVLNTYLEIGLHTNREDELKHLRTIILTGERVGKELVNRFYKIYSIPLINAYGQSECSDDTLHYHIPYSKDNSMETVCIGKPSNNTQVYILDKYGKPQPIGIEGEICISGDGVALGYLNDDKLTAEKFIANDLDPSKILFKTGDFGRWLSDGNIEFKGRLDHQIKIRGFRIEVEEIEDAILHIEGINQAVVLLRQDDKEESLYSYYVSNKEYSSIALKEQLAKHLPSYMIPKYMIQLENFPVNSNGKIDIEALKVLKNINTNNNVEDITESEVESELKKIWMEILNIKQINVNDNFFELGGHSLKATILSARIENLYHKHISLRSIFNYPTIRTLSRYLEMIKKEEYINFKPLSNDIEFYDLSPSQMGIYIAQMNSVTSMSYNIPIVFNISGELDVLKVKIIFKKLIERHDVFRTSFIIIGNKPMQVIKNDIDFSLDYEEGIYENEIDIDQFIKPFDLEKAPLFRVKLIKKANLDSILLIDFHHIIVDGVSIGIILDEFMQLYQEKELPVIHVNYKDYIYWKKDLEISKKYGKYETYWKKQLQQKVVRNELPLDYIRPQRMTFEGNKLYFYLNETQKNKIYEILKETNSTLFIFLLAAYNILLCHYTKQYVTTVGSSISGRGNTDFEKVVGLFINLLPIRNVIERSDTFIGFLEKVKTNVIDALDNQEYPFESIIKLEGDVREVGRNPFFDSIFDVQNMDIKTLEIDGLSIKQIQFKEKFTQGDIVVAVVDEKEKIAISMTYNTTLYKEETIEKLGNKYLKVLDEITSDSEQLIDTILNSLYSEEVSEKISNEMYNYVKGDLDDLFEF